MTQRFPQDVISSRTDNTEPRVCYAFRQYSYASNYFMKETHFLAHPSLRPRLYVAVCIKKNKGKKKTFSNPEMFRDLFSVYAKFLH